MAALRGLLFLRSEVPMQGTGLRVEGIGFRE